MTNIILILILVVLVVVAYFMFTTKDMPDPSTQKRPQGGKPVQGQKGKSQSAKKPSAAAKPDSRFDDPLFRPIVFESEIPEPEEINFRGMMDRQFWTDYINLPMQSDERKREILSVLLDYAIIDREQYAAMMSGKAVPGQKEDAPDPFEEAERRFESESRIRPASSPKPVKPEPEHKPETEPEPEDVSSPPAAGATAPVPAKEPQPTPPPTEEDRLRALQVIEAERRRRNPDEMRRRMNMQPSAIESFTRPASAFARPARPAVPSQPQNPATPPVQQPRPVVQHQGQPKPAVALPLQALLPKGFFDDDDFGDF